MILFAVSYFAGMLTIVSPCILPVLPFVFARADRPFLRNGLPLLSMPPFILLRDFSSTGIGSTCRAFLLIWNPERFFWPKMTARYWAAFIWSCSWIEEGITLISGFWQSILSNSNLESDPCLWMPVKITVEETGLV